jgi:hypothetical protein
MTKKQVCALIGISPKTLERRMAKGVYKFTRTDEGQYAHVSFTHADVGLPEPAPASEPVISPAPAVPEPIPEPEFAPVPLGAVELQREADERFAQDYKRGEATDSAGNTINGTNARWPTKGIQTLLGPMEPKPRERVQHVTTMEKIALAQPQMIGTDGEPVLHAGSDNHPYFGAHNRACGGPSKPRHPNQKRQEMLNTIFADIRRGFSR